MIKLIHLSFLKDLITTSEMWYMHMYVNFTNDIHLHMFVHSFSLRFVYYSIHIRCPLTIALSVYYSLHPWLWVCITHCIHGFVEYTYQIAHKTWEHILGVIFSFACHFKGLLLQRGTLQNMGEDIASKKKKNCV